MDIQSYLKQCNLQLQALGEVTLFGYPFQIDRLPLNIGIAMPNEIIPNIYQSNIIYPFTYDGKVTYLLLHNQELNTFLKYKILTLEKGVFPEQNLLFPDTKFNIAIRDLKNFLTTYSEFKATNLKAPPLITGSLPFPKYNKPYILIVEHKNTDDVLWVSDIIKHGWDNIFVYETTDFDDDVQVLCNNSSTTNEIGINLPGAKDWLTNELNYLYGMNYGMLTKICRAQAFTKEQVDGFVGANLYPTTNITLRNRSTTAFVLGNGIEIKNENDVLTTTNLKGYKSIIANFNLNIEGVHQLNNGDRNYKASIKKGGLKIDCMIDRPIDKLLPILCSEREGNPYLTSYNGSLWPDVLNCMSEGSTVTLEEEKTGFYKDKLVLPGITITKDCIARNEYRSLEFQGIRNNYENMGYLDNLLKNCKLDGTHKRMLAGVVFVAYNLRRYYMGDYTTRHLIYTKQNNILKNLNYLFNNTYQVEVGRPVSFNEKYLSIFDWADDKLDYRHIPVNTISTAEYHECFILNQPYVVYLKRNCYLLNPDMEFMKTLQKAIPEIIQKIVFKYDGEEELNRVFTSLVWPRMTNTRLFSYEFNEIYNFTVLKRLAAAYSVKVKRLTGNQYCISKEDLEQFVTVDEARRLINHTKILVGENDKYFILKKQNKDFFKITHEDYETSVAKALAETLKN